MATIVDPAKLERRRQILAAAKQVFADAGYHGTSISAIIERAQIARGTFYLYFESKAAVFDSILDEAMTDLRARIRRIEVEDPGAPPPQVQLREQVIGTLQYIIRDRALAVLLLSAGHTPDAEAAERLDQFFSEVRGIAAGALTANGGGGASAGLDQDSALSGNDGDDSDASPASGGLGSADGGNGGAGKIAPTAGGFTLLGSFGLGGGGGGAYGRIEIRASSSTGGGLASPAAIRSTPTYD